MTESSHPLTSSQDDSKPGKSIPSNWLSFGLELLFLFTLAIAILPFFFTNGSLDGDGLEYLMLYQDLFRDGFSFANWSPPPGRGVELIVLLDFLLFFITAENLVLTSYLSALMKCFCLYASTRLLFRVTFEPSKQLSLLFAFALTVMLAWAYYLLASTYVIFTNSNNLKLLLYLSLANLLITCLLLIERHNRKQDYVWLVAIVWIGVVGTAKFAAFVAVPCLASWCAMAGLAWWFKKPHRGRLFVSSAVFFVAFCIGYLVLYPAAYPKYHLLLAYTPKHFKDISVTFSNFLGLLHTAFSGDFFLISFLCLQGVMLLFLLFQFYSHLRALWTSKELNSKRFTRGYLVGLALAATLICLMANLLLSKGNVSRYFTYIFYYLCLASMTELFFWLRSKNLELSFQRLSVLMVSVCVVLSSANLWALPQLKLAKVTMKEMLSLSPKAGDSQGLTHCLQANKKRYNLAYGLAEYWTARPIQMMSSGSIRVYQIDPKSLSFYHWNNNIGYYWEGSKKLGQPTYNFMIVGYQEIHDEFRRYLNVQTDQKLVRSIQQRLDQLKKQGLSDVMALKQIAVNSRNVKESDVMKLFGKPSATFTCKLISGDIRKVLVYHKDTRFDAKVKYRFFQHYLYWVKVKKYPFKLKSPVFR